MTAEAQTARRTFLNRLLFYGGLLALLAAVYGWVHFYQMGSGIHLSWVFLLFPGAVMLINYEAKGGNLSVFALALCLALSLFFSLVAVIGQSFRTELAEVTDPKRYSEKLEGYWKSNAPELVAHFPVVIPPDAERVKFYFNPSFLQGGARLYLHYATTSERIQALYEKYSQQRTKEYDLRGKSKLVSVEHQRLLPPFLTGEGDEHWQHFPDDFDIMYFDPFIPEATMAKSGFFWNHGEGHGVGISRKRSEIIYWAEYW
jgi:hypothetical protein